MFSIHQRSTVTHPGFRSTTTGRTFAAPSPQRLAHEPAFSTP
jgi:hypothetical protein